MSILVHFYTDRFPLFRDVFNTFLIVYHWAYSSAQLVQSDKQIEMICCFKYQEPRAVMLQCDINHFLCRHDRRNTLGRKDGDATEI